jgi:hypothetical protein
MGRLRFSFVPLERGSYQRSVFYELVSQSPRTGITAIELSLILALTVFVTFWMI